MSLFPVVIADGENEMPNEDIYYIIGKEGIFLKKKLGIMESLSPVKGISILQSVQATARMHIEKLPAIATAKISNFFREIYKEHRSEAIVLLFYNEETKKYKLVPPSQKVSAGGIDYNRSITIDGYTMIGDFHSHASMSAFHSGIDQGDEESFDGLHITLGNMGSDLISISASIVSNGNRTIVDPNEYIEGIKLEKEINEVEKIPTTKTYKWMEGKMIEVTPKYSATTYKSYRKFDKRYSITSEKNIKAKTPKSWMDTVEKKVYTYSGYGLASWQGWGGNYQGGHWQNGKWVPPKYNQGWGGNFDSNVWKNKPGSVANQIRNDLKQPPQNVGVKVEPIKFPDHDQNGPVITDVTPSRYLPCKTCSFKEKAVEYVAELLVEENKGIIEEKMCSDFDKEVYECQKCNMILSFEYNNDGEIEGDIICPECKSDEFLLEIIDDDEAIFNDGSDVITNDGFASDYEIPGFIACKSCQSKMDASILVDTEAGACCPICDTLLIPNQELNYEKKNEKFICKTCSSEFTYDMAKNGGACPFCKEPLIKLGNEELLGADADAIEEAVRKEVEEYNSKKETPNPANMIPTPVEEKTKPTTTFDWLKQRFIGRK